jgi:hypothetical protein
MFGKCKEISYIIGGFEGYGRGKGYIIKGKGR